MQNLTIRVMLVLALATAGCAETPTAARPSASEHRHVEPDRRHVEPDRRRVEPDRRQQECLALAIYWEARGEGRHGMEGVGWTVLNRVDSSQFPSTPCAVVYEGGERPGCQFSWYCDGKSDRPRDRESWRQAMRTAADLLSRPGTDPTGGALFFHAAGAGTVWHRQLLQTARIGGHVFYR